jgi:hypothetical protein
LRNDIPTICRRRRLEDLLLRPRNTERREDQVVYFGSQPGSILEAAYQKVEKADLLEKRPLPP